MGYKEYICDGKADSCLSCPLEDCMRPSDKAYGNVMIKLPKRRYTAREMDEAIVTADADYLRRRAYSWTAHRQRMEKYINGLKGVTG